VSIISKSLTLTLITDTISYSGTQASTGQTSAQAAQSVHNSGLIWYLGSPSLIASAGHSSLQVPHMIQSSVILWGIFPPPLNFDFGIKLFYNLIGILVMHQGSEINRLQAGTRTVKTPFAKVLLKNLPGFGVLVENLAYIHFFVYPSFPFRHNPQTSTNFIRNRRFINENFPVQSKNSKQPATLYPTLSLWITGKMI
jgi:hypothetical protein